jgi:hypothetical protein
MKLSQNNYLDLFMGFDHSNNISVECAPKENAKSKTHFYLSLDEKKEVLQELNDPSLILLDYYYTRLTTPKYDYWNDGLTADSLGWSKKKVQNTRLMLVNGGYLKRVSYTQPTTKDKHTTYYIGKLACSKIITPEEFTQQAKEREEALRKVMENTNTSSVEELRSKYTDKQLTALVAEVLRQ